MPPKNERVGGGQPQPPVAVNIDGIPKELRDLRHWVAWKLTPPKKPGAKFGKVPINPRTGGNASSTDPTTWGTFDEALEAMQSRKLAGIGFMFGGSGYTGVDLDHCRHTDSGKIVEGALTTMNVIASYTEVSPSGTGVHCILRGKLPGPGRKRGNVEIYDSGRFFTITGVVVPGTPTSIAQNDKAIADIYAALAPAIVQPSADTPPTDLEDDALIARATKAKNGSKFSTLWQGDTSDYGSQSEADLALCGILRFWTRGDRARMDRLFRRSGLFRPKWDEKHGAGTYGERTIEIALASSEMAEKASFPLTDTGNAERLVEQYGSEVRYCYAWNKWVTYDNGHWRIDDQGKPMLLSKKVARSILVDASKIEDQTIREATVAWATKCEKVDRRKAMVDLSRCEPRIPIAPSWFDTHPYLLNCPNGTLDLETGVLREHRRDDYLTKRCPTRYVPDAPCPTWLAFLERILPDDDERAYAQRFFGYGTSGDVSEQVLPLFIGGGANGKSTLARAIQDTLSANYAIQISSDLLIAKEQRNHPTEVADLFGVRLAFGIETQEGQQLDEALVKQLTGSDRIRARRMREDFWEFEPTHKIVLLTNHMPRVVGRDYAIWRRLHIVRFDVTIPPAERDKQLLQKLAREREGILAWLVAGFREWRKHGLNPPESVLVTPTFEQPRVVPAREFIQLFVKRELGARVGATDLYMAFREWCAEAILAPCEQREFGVHMGAMGHGRKKTGGVYVYVDAAFSGPPRPKRDDEGPKGPSSGLNALESPRVEENQGSRPHRPQSSLSASDAAPKQSVLIDADQPWEH